MVPSRRLSAAVVAMAVAGTLTARAQQDPFPEGAVYSQALANLNASLGTARGVAIDSAEISVSPDGGWSGATTLIANDRTHQFGSNFVARDPRRGGSDAISYLVDQSDGSALAFAVPGPGIVTLPNSVTEPIIDAAMARWDNQPNCPGPPIVKVADNGADPDLIDGLVFGDPSRIGTPFA